MSKVMSKSALIILSCMLLLVALLIQTNGAPAIASNQPAVQTPAGGLPDHHYSPTLSYYYAAGSTLHTTDHLMDSDYQSGGCLSAIGASNQFFSVMLDLPEGARIDFLRVYYYDTSANNGSASIRKYDSLGNTDTIIQIASSGDTGYGTVVSGYVGHVVENANGGYVLNWVPNDAVSGMRICGMRVAYRLPAELLYLPSALVD